MRRLATVAVPVVLGLSLCWILIFWAVPRQVPTILEPIVLLRESLRSRAVLQLQGRWTHKHFFTAGVTRVLE